MKLSLFIPGIPQPKQSVRARVVHTSSGKSFVQTYQKAEIKENERSIKMIIREQLPKDFILLSKGISVTKLHYVFPPISSLKKKQKDLIAAGELVAKTTKPDLTDNLQKGLWDAMQGIVFLNDSQICAMNDVKKVYGNIPGITIELEEIDDQQKSLFNN